jgi:hypothetical protein
MPGVYELADERRTLIYIGQSARDVPNRLRQHLARPGCIADHAAYWRYRYSRVPQAEEADLLAEHQRRHGRLPCCNRRAQQQRDAQRRIRERFSGE